MKIEDYIVSEQGFLIDFVAWIFSDVLKYILFTPLELFKSVTATSVLQKMCLFSGALVTILAMFEGLKRIVSMQYTPISQILFRYPIALCVSAASPFLFYYGALATNEMVKFMGIITNSSIVGTDYYSSILQGYGEHVMETIVVFIFLIVLIFYVFRILLYHANRWFGLLFNMVATPLAMSAFIFKPYEQVAIGWFKDSVKKLMIVVVHSFFLGLIGIILYAPTTEFVADNVGVVKHAIVKILFSIGGLHMMLRPPQWISAWFDSGDNFNSTRKAFRPVKLIVKKLIPFGK